MPDIIEMLVEFLCQMNTQSQCWSFIGNYAEATQQMVFFIFFPVVFLILFVYFMAHSVIKEHKGLRLLIGVAIFMFIVFQGWYHIVLIVSKFWFIALIILGGLGVVVHRMTGRGGGGSTGPSTQKAAEGLSSWAKTAVFGGRELDPRKIAANRKLCQSELARIENTIRRLERERERLRGNEKSQSEVVARMADLEKEAEIIRHRMEEGLPPHEKT